MSNKKNLDKQYLSGLLDDQVTDQAIEWLLSGSENQANAWYRYNVVRSVLNKEHSAFSSFEFTQSISAQIAKQPALLARHDNVVSIFPAWKKTIGGFAMAASVAFAMVFSVQMMNAPGQPVNGGIEMATQVEPTLLPVEMKASPFEFNAEQAELDHIQRLLNQMNRSGLNITEELVGGEFMVQSYVVKAKPTVTPFEEKIRKMRKPSEMSNPN